MPQILGLDIHRAEMGSGAAGMHTEMLRQYQRLNWEGGMTSSWCAGAGVRSPTREVESRSATVNTSVTLAMRAVRYDRGVVVLFQCFACLIGLMKMAIYEKHHRGSSSNLQLQPILTIAERPDLISLKSD